MCSIYSNVQEGEGLRGQGGGTICKPISKACTYFTNICIQLTKKYAE